MKLHDFIRDGKYQKVENLLQEGADIYEKNGFGLDALGQAVKYDQSELIQLILSHSKRKHFESLNNGLISAILQGNYKLMSEFVSLGADVNYRCPLKHLDYAVPFVEIFSNPNVINQWQRFADYLINNHANIDIQDKNGATALINTSFRNKPVATRVINYLLENGADPNIQDNAGYSALHIVCSRGNLEAASLLLDHGAKLELRNDKGMTPLLLAIVNNNTLVVNYLIKQGASIHARNNMGESSLLVACNTRKCHGIVNLLIQHGIDINDDSFGETPLMRAVDKSCSMEVIAALVLNGADIHRPCSLHDNMTPTQLLNTRSKDRRNLFETILEQQTLESMIQSDSLEESVTLHF